MIRPNLDESFGYDNNPGGLPGSRGSMVVVTAPHVDISSDFSRDSVGLSLGISDKRYVDQPEQNRTDYTASTSTSILIGRDKLTVQGSYLALHEDRTQIDSETLQTPLGYTAKQLRVIYTIDLGAWRVEPNAAFLSYRFDDVIEPGDVISQKARDRDLYAAGMTVRYGQEQSRTALFTARAVDSNYVNWLGGQARPDSFAYEALAGTDYALSGNLRFLALVGYEFRKFSHSAYKNLSSPVVETSAIWTPTGLTTLIGQASRSVEDSIGEATSGVNYTRAHISIDHEYLRNILLRGTAGVEIADYVTGGREVIYRAGAGATYLINRNLRARLSYDFEDHIGAQNGLSENLTGPITGRGAGDYTRNIVLLVLSAAL